MGGIRRINRTLAYEGKILDVYLDDMEFPNGVVEQWDFMSHRKGAAAVLAVTEDGRIPMVRQYRNALGRFTWEIPAGCRDSADEAYELCAARELEEETGYIAGHIEPLVTVAGAVAYCDEIVPVFLATNLSVGKQHLDPAEFVDVKLFELSELEAMIYEQKIQDGKTISAVLAYKNKYCS